MSRRSLVLLVCALLGALVPPTALGVRAKVRVEGKTTTIFGASEPALEVRATALDALEAASAAGEFYYHVTQFSFGPFVDQIGRYPTTPAEGWLFKVNGALAQVAADKVTLKSGDTVLWYFAPFGQTGTPTLKLVRRPRGCYEVRAQDDQARETPASGAVLEVDGRRVRTRAARACPGPHRGLVRATLAGAVRSNALR